MEVEKYKLFDLELAGTDKGNPYKEIWILAEFSNGNEKYQVRGFYKGKGRYGIRFMPSETGKWIYTISSNDGLLDGKYGEFLCTPPEKENHGRVCLKKKVQNREQVNYYTMEDDFQFAYQDGKRYIPVGTTCYAWVNQPEWLQEQTLETLASAPFNKIRMCIFPKYYTYNNKNPRQYPFEGNLEQGFDFSRFYEPFWENLEKRICQLDQLGIEADIILFHPYDRWGFARMSKEQDIFYLSYAVNRLCHFKNVWWSLANEYDLLPWKSGEDWEDYARVICQNDPYGHLASVHNCLSLYDYTRPWITHCSIQRIDVYKTAEMITDWRQEYKKPVILDEAGYEGNIDSGWGNLTGEELVRRFWEGYMRGGFVTHGETYVDKGEWIWWSHGGKLYGESPKRIAFLKQVMEEMPETAVPLKLTMENHDQNWDAPCIYDQDQYFLYYYGFSRPLYRNYVLPEGGKYQIELLDTWNMRVERLEELYEGHVRIQLPGVPYMAVRMRKIQ